MIAGEREKKKRRITLIPVFAGKETEEQSHNCADYPYPWEEKEEDRIMPMTHVITVKRRTTE